METDQKELLVQISSFLEKYQIQYMITGAWSVIYYGRPRASHDIDFVVEIYQKDLQKILEAFNNLSEEFLVETDSIKEATQHQSLFMIIHLPTMLKLDFWLLTKNQFDQARFTRKKRVKILDHYMKIASAEDTIIQKLIWYRQGKIEKHLVDAAFVIQIQQKNLDKKYLEGWIKKLKLDKYYKSLTTLNLKEYL